MTTRRWFLPLGFAFTLGACGHSNPVESTETPPPVIRSLVIGNSWTERGQWLDSTGVELS